MDRCRALFAFLLLAILIVPIRGVAAPDSRNLTLVESFDFNTGNEIDFEDELVFVSRYQARDAQIKVFRIRKGKVAEAGEIPCGFHNDVDSMGNGLLAVSFQGSGVSCTDPGPLPNNFVAGQGGVQALDVSNLRKPRYVGTVELPGGVHTLTHYPDSPYVYASLGGADVYTVHGGKEHIIDLSDPRNPKIAATYSSPLNPAGCHDVTFAQIEGKMIGFCPGLGGTEIWDASDPEAPSAIARMTLPVGQLPHLVAVSSDGQLAAISDEAYAGHTCTGGGPSGALWFYDISDLTNPEMIGFYGPPRGNLPVGAFSGARESCTAHNFNFIPGTKHLVTAWIGGGTNVLDLSDPANPVEIAHWKESDSAAMSSYWYRGLIFVGDFSRGLDVLELDLPKAR